MYSQWLEDQNEDYLKSKNQSILVGSFFNPEAAKKMLELDGSTKFESSEEDFDATWKMVQNQNRRKRRRLMDGA